MDDPSLVRHSELLVEAVHAIEKANSSIKRSTTKLVSLKEMSKERSKVKSIIDQCNSHDVPSVYDAISFFEKYLKLHPQYSSGIKFVNDARSALSTYQTVSDQFYRKCCEIEESSLKSSRGKGKPKGKLNDEDIQESNEELSERSPFIRSSHELTQCEEFERNLHDEIIQERNREVKEIAESVKDIHEIFVHINELVGEQGEKLDIVDDNVKASERATRNAAEQLRMARDAQDKARRNQVILLIIVVIVVGIIVAVMTA